MIKYGLDLEIRMEKMSHGKLKWLIIFSIINGRIRYAMYHVRM